MVLQIYVIIRNRKGASGYNRMQRLLHRPLFNMLRQYSPDFDTMVAKKLVVLAGDLELPQCGMTGKDYQLVCSEVDYIIHSAANTSFSDPLSTLLRNNYWVRSHVFQIHRLYLNAMSEICRLQPPATSASKCKIACPLIINGCHIMVLCRSAAATCAVRDQFEAATSLQFRH